MQRLARPPPTCSTKELQHLTGPMLRHRVVAAQHRGPLAQVPHVAPVPSWRRPLAPLVCGAGSAVAERTVQAGEASTSANTAVENVVIIGSGPAGYTAAIYAARANLKPVVFEGLRNGRGGQLMTTTEVENFPGFPEGITGPDLMDRMRKQAERWGAELYTDDVESVDLSRRPFTVRGVDTEVRTHSIIIATGATAKRLSLPSEGEFWSKGISACAICDGASHLFKNRPVAVVGGGDSAAEEAVYLTKYASHVHLLVRGEKMRASKAMADRALNNSKVTVHFNTGIEDVYGEEVMTGLKLFNTKTGEKSELKASGLFYGIGHSPNSKLLDGQIALDEKGYVKVDHGVATSVEGVFAAGDLHDQEWRQAITAAGSGCMAALSVERYLTMNNLGLEYKHQEQRTAAKDTADTASMDVEDDMDNFDIDAETHRGQYALRKLYHESDRLIAVLYTAPTCGPCRTLKPIFKNVISEYKGKVHYVEINIEEDGEVAEAAGVMGTPTVQFFKNKARLQHWPGVKPKKEYRALIAEHTQ